MANANPGPDTIEFTPGLKVDARNESESFLGIGSADQYVLARITDELVIDGQGGELFGAKAWVDQNGRQTFTTCPESSSANDTDILIISSTPGLFSLGKNNKDNSEVAVTLRNLTIRQFNHVAYINKNASLIMEDVNVEEIWSSFRCGFDPLILAKQGASVTLRRSLVKNFYNFTDTTAAFMTSPAILGDGAGDLVIEDSSFEDINGTISDHVSSVFWNGAANSTVNIVNSVFFDAGGIRVAGDVSETNIVNSIWNNLPVNTPGEADRFTNDSGGDMNIIASTLMWNSDGCDMACQDPEAIPLYFFERLGAGKINFSGSAIGINFPVDPGSESVLTLHDGSTGGFTADAYTWIQPTILQDAATLKTITGQPGLRTDPVAFNTPVFTFFLTPLATPAPGGQLIDVIPDAGSGETNELINPVTGNPILLDALGNPRVEEVAVADFRRNIGAIQLTFDPHLSLSGSGDGYVDLHWTRPLVPETFVLTGYEVLYSVKGAGSWTTIPVSGPDTLEHRVIGLTNGTEYEFEVRAIGTSIDENYAGPWSNTVTATPYGEIGTPVVTATPGDGEVAPSWTLPDLGGRTFEAYTLLWRVAGTTDFTDALGIFNPGVTSTTITGLKNGTAYEFAVAVNASGEVSEQGLATATPHGDVGTVDRNPDESLPATKRANRPRYWETLGYGECTKFEVADDFGSVWLLASDASALILKSDNINDVWVDPVAGQYGTALAQNISHVIVCTHSL